MNCLIAALTKNSLLLGLNQEGVNVFTSFVLTVSGTSRNGCKPFALQRRQGTWVMVHKLVLYSSRSFVI